MISNLEDLAKNLLSVLITNMDNCGDQGAAISPDPTVPHQGASWPLSTILVLAMDKRMATHSKNLELNPILRSTLKRSPRGDVVMGTCDVQLEHHPMLLKSLVVHSTHIKLS